MVIKNTKKLKIFENSFIKQNIINLVKIINLKNIIKIKIINFRILKIYIRLFLVYYLLLYILIIKYKI